MEMVLYFEDTALPKHCLACAYPGSIDLVHEGCTHLPLFFTFTRIPVSPISMKRCGSAGTRGRLLPLIVADVMPPGSWASHTRTGNRSCSLPTCECTGVRETLRRCARNKGAWNATARQGGRSRRALHRRVPTAASFSTMTQWAAGRH